MAKDGYVVRRGRSCLLELSSHGCVAIDTEAINLIAGEDFRKKCRRPEIMADAVHAIITQSSRSCTGQFFVDETLLRQQGVTDFEQYAVVPGTKDFMLDFFLDENIDELQRYESAMGNKGKAPAADVKATGAVDVAQIFDRIKTMLSPELLKKIDSVYAFDLQGEIRRRK